MEDLLVHLRKSLRRLGDQLVTVREDMAMLKENVRHLPTKPWMFATLASTAIIIVAVIGLVIRFLPDAQ